MNLQKILNGIIEKYGKNEGYEIPTISWSEENQLDRFGEYQYWKNHIVVSRLFDTDKISKMAVESIIFHEYTHQLYSEHNDDFNARMKLFEGYEEANRELQDYLNSLENMAPAKALGTKLDKVKTMLVKVYMNKDDNDSYWKNIYYCDHYMLVYAAKNLPDNYEGRYDQVIFTVDFDKATYIVGWAKNVLIHSKKYVCDLTKYGYEKLDYHIKYKRDEGDLLLPGSCLSLGYTKDMPLSYTSAGICELSELGKEDEKTIINIINCFDSDFHELGLHDDAIDSVPGIEIKDVSKIIDMSKQEISSMRKIWIMNKAVELEQSYRTYMERALANENGSLLDCAMVDIARALAFKPQANYKDMSDNRAKEMFERCMSAHRKFNADID